jgi:hypothetical protein
MLKRSSGCVVHSEEGTSGPALQSLGGDCNGCECPEGVKAFSFKTCFCDTSTNRSILVNSQKRTSRGFIFFWRGANRDPWRCKEGYSYDRGMLTTVIQECMCRAMAVSEFIISYCGPSPCEDILNHADNVWLTLHLDVLNCKGNPCTFDLN